MGFLFIRIYIILSVQSAEVRQGAMVSQDQEWVKFGLRFCRNAAIPFFIGKCGQKKEEIPKDGRRNIQRTRDNEA